MSFANRVDFISLTECASLTAAGCWRGEWETKGTGDDKNKKGKLLGASFLLLEVWATGPTGIFIYWGSELRTVYGVVARRSQLNGQQGAHCS